MEPGTTSADRRSGRGAGVARPHRLRPTRPADPPQREGSLYLTLTVPVLEPIVDRCSQAGAAIPVPPTHIAVGIRFAMVVDPDGNWLEFLQRD